MTKISLITMIGVHTLRLVGSALSYHEDYYVLSVSGFGMARSLPSLGLGNELVWQSINDTVLATKVGQVGGTVGRYPGGTPSDYWDWQSGWTTQDFGSLPVREATPAQWAKYSAVAKGSFANNQSSSLLVMNQLTSNVSHGLAGLHAHKAAGTDVLFIELGNEMYDETRPDVIAAYPNGSTYATKMSEWSTAIAMEFPNASIALVGMTWRPDISVHQQNWNAQVFNQSHAKRLEHISAATLHPYFPLTWNHMELAEATQQQQLHTNVIANTNTNTNANTNTNSNTNANTNTNVSVSCGDAGVGASGPYLTDVSCSDECCCQTKCDQYTGDGGECKAWQWIRDGSNKCYFKSTTAMLPNANSISGINGPPTPPLPPDPSDVSQLFASVINSALENQKFVANTIPARLKLWVTEVAAYGAADLNFTWLKSLANVLFETMLLLMLPQVDILTPYCVVCGDPIAPNFNSPQAQANPPTHSVVPPDESDLVQWQGTLRSEVHAAYFLLVRDAPANSVIEKLMFDVQQPQQRKQQHHHQQQPQQQQDRQQQPRQQQHHHHQHQQQPQQREQQQQQTTFVGWRIQAKNETLSMFVMQLSATAVTLNLNTLFMDHHHHHYNNHDNTTSSPLFYNARVLYPKAEEDLVTPLLSLDALGQRNYTRCNSMTILLPPYSITSLSVIPTK